MFEMSRTARDTYLEKLFYQRLGFLGSVLNSRVMGGPLPTMIRAFLSILSDAIEEIKSLFLAYDVINGTGAAADQARGFFKRPRLLAARSEQVFTVLRKTASTPLVVPIDATVQTGVLQSGKAYSYSIESGDDTTLPIGTFYELVTFSSIETGAVTAISTIQELQLVSGLSDCFVVSGAWDKSSADPLSTFDPATQTFDAWLIANQDHFTSMFRLQGRDDETDEAHLARCLARWDEQAAGATSASYEGMTLNYTDPVSGNAPVALAKVTLNQVFNSAISKAPALQPLINGQEYVMGVEIAVAFRDGIFPAPADLQKIADSLLPKKAHTDRIWLRGPNLVSAGAGTCTVTVRGPASLQPALHKLVASFFVYDTDYIANYQGLGSTIYMSEIVTAVKNFSTEILDAKVAFVLAGKVSAGGDIVLDAFDQIDMSTPSTGVVVTIL